MSRAIFDEESGSVTLFAFDEGQRLSEHTVPFHALLYIIEGEAEVTVSGKPFKVEEGEALLMHANESHSVRAIKRFKMLLTMLKS